MLAPLAFDPLAHPLPGDPGFPHRPAGKAEALSQKQ
jgi:hypothetical protein